MRKTNDHELGELSYDWRGRIDSTRTAERGTVDRVEREVADRFGAAVDVGTLLSKRLLRRRVRRRISIRSGPRAFGPCAPFW